MTIVSNGLWAYELEDAVGATTQVFLTKRVSLTRHRPLIRACDLAGNPIAQLDGEVSTVIWRADGYGTASMYLTPAESGRQLPYTLYETPIKLEFENGLPCWGGIIDLPRERGRDLTTHTLYSPGYFLSWPLTDEKLVYEAHDGWRPDEAMLDALALSDAGRQYGLEVSDVRGWPQEVRSVTLDASRSSPLAIAEAIRQNNEDYHWFVEPYPYGNSLRFVYRHFYRFNRDMRNAVQLIEGHNLFNVEVIWQGPIFSHIVVAAGNYDPNDPERREYVYEYDDGRTRMRRSTFVTLTDVIGDRGRLQGTLIPIGEVLAQRAEAEYRRYQKPLLRFRGSTINRQPAPFGEYSIGDIVTIILNRQEFGTVAFAFLILGMEFDVRTGLMTLVGEHMTDEQLVG